MTFFFKFPLVSRINPDNLIRLVIAKHEKTYSNNKPTCSIMLNFISSVGTAAE